jgi:alpha-1,2-mannosyltransferase
MTPPVSRSVRVLGPSILALALVLYVAAYLKWPSLANQVDLLVYRFGASRVWDGQDLYSVGMTGNSQTMLFDYTPFSALCFLPLSGLDQAAVLILGLAVNVACVAYLVVRMLRAAGVSSTAGLWGLSALVIALALWLEPIRLSLQLGQINIMVMTLVIADVLAPSSRRWTGVLIGIAAGIKLTPALFIVFLIATGRRRAAATATATFVATVVAGFLLLPPDSRHFWLQRGFDDIRRISSDPLANTSLKGLLLRMHWATGWETVVSGALAVAALTIAVLAWRRGQRVLAVAIVGMASAAASPFSWSHHWVWFVPLLAHLGVRAYTYRSRTATVALWALAAAFGGWFIESQSSPPQSGLLSLRHPGLWDQLLPATYLFAFLLVLVASAWTFRRITPQLRATADAADAPERERLWQAADAAS